MYRYLYTAAAAALLALTGCSDRSEEKAALTQEVTAASTAQTIAPGMQLSAADRIPQAEAAFLEKIKSSVSSGNKAGFKALYALEGADPRYVAMTDSIFSSNWTKFPDDITYEIQPNQKAQQHGITFTVPYLGDLIITLKNKYGTSRTKIPVGIREGVYYLTLAAKK